MRRALALWLLVAPVPAAAGELTLTTRTLLLGRGGVRGVQSEVPLYQWIEISGRDLAHPGLSAHASLWGFGALDGGGFERGSGAAVSGDVDLFFGQYHDPKGRFSVRVGRQLLLSGPGSGLLGQLDGAWVRGAASGFEVELYGGRVVESRFGNASQYDWLVGGRGGYRSWGRFTAGLSYLHARNDGEVSREVAGVDASLDLLDDLDIVGFAAYDLVDPGLLESTLMARWRGVENLAVGLGMRQASPGRLIDRTSIFSVFSLGDYAEATVDLDYRVNQQWSVGVDYARVFFPDEDGAGLGASAHRFGVRASGWARRDLRLIVAFDRVPAGDEGYWAARLAGQLRASTDATVTAELLTYTYDGRDTPSVGGRLFGQYALGSNLTIGMGGELGSTVYSSFDARFLLRMTWTERVQIGRAG